MAESLRDCWPQLDIPDRPPDSSAPLNVWDERAVWENRYEMWYATPDAPGVALTTRWADHFSDHEPYEDTLDVQWLGHQGLQLMLDYVGVQAYTFGDTAESLPTAAALMYPTTAQFCSRFNHLLDSEHPKHGPPLRLVPFTDPEPVYCLSTLAAHLDAGELPISDKPPQDSHDQLHAIALYGVIDQLPETPGRLADEFEAILSLGALVGIMTSPEINDHQSWADSIWRRVLGLNNRKDVNAVFRRIQERVDSTPYRLARLAVDSSG
jgi:hypothetical protein